MQVQAIALSGMISAESRLDAGARRIASDPTADLVQERVEQMQDSESFRANTTVLKTGEQMSKTVLDLKV